MEIKTYLGIIARRKWVIISTAISFIAVVIVIARYIPQQFSATAQLRVTTPTGGSSNYVDFNIWYADRLMNTYAELAKSSSIREELLKQLNLSQYPSVSVDVVPNSELITITSQSSDPKLSATISNTLAKILIEHNLSDKSNNSAEVFLNDRYSSVKQELEQAKNDYQAMIGPNSSDKTRIDFLNQSIDQNNQVYIVLKNNYEDNLLKKADPILLNDLFDQMFSLSQNIKKDQAELESLNVQMITNSQKMEALKGVIDLKEKDLSNIQSLLDQTKITDLIKENSNVVPIVDPAIPSDQQASSRQLLVYILGVILSLGIAVGLGFLVDLFDDRLLTIDQIRSLTQLKLIGKIPSVRNIRRIYEVGNNNIFSEAIRRLRINIDLMAETSPIKSIIFCSASPQEGKTTIISSLARDMACVGRKVILVDTDMRIPSIQSYFNIPNEVGLSTYLAEDKPVRDVISETDLMNLHIITSGPIMADPVILTNSDQLKTLIIDLEQNYDMVLVDAPSFLELGDVKELVTLLDGIVVVVCRGNAREPKVKEMIDELDDFKPRLLGLVINRVKMSSSYDYYHKKNGIPRFPQKDKVNHLI